MSAATPTAEPARKVSAEPTNGATPASMSRFPGLEDEYVKAELHNGIVIFADIREFTSYMDGNSDYAISLLACFRRVLSLCFSGKALKANENDRYTTFAKELGDGVMMVWIAEQASITDISVDEITGLAFASQEIVKRFFDLSADFAPEKYHVGIGIAIGSFQRLLYRDKVNPAMFRYRDYTGGTINLAARLEGLSRPNGVTLCFNALPLNKKKEIVERLSGQDFKEATHDIRGLGKTKVFQWKLNLEEPVVTEEGRPPGPEKEGSESSAAPKEREPACPAEPPSSGKVEAVS
jgi:class 3 adenylate cyclase